MVVVFGKNHAIIGKIKLYSQEIITILMENIYPEDIAEQIKEVAGDKLIDYYTKRLIELQK